MVIAFQIILLAVMGLSIFGIIGERENKGIRDALLTAFIASTAAYIASVMLL
ncbi:NADH-quinone oxidoreductase subunit K [Sporosarcina newyorkensis 2681]|uniref:NADH-quinone oxidoreductase subunit K n=1 Tax=Sporosarcina newyorkensis 2681 TaxID=1027292 RepID=F9DX43_9BACL|nr:hypothetical protein [Sporosarcina newyorkensis]EGQ21091.1 NADH-quinone oxidoreductase subunit K [Sporosarcina newyorkensis 2681]